jgi:hypothetical protein
MKAILSLLLIMAAAANAQQPNNSELALTEGVASQILDVENENFQIARNGNKVIANKQQMRSKTADVNLNARQMLAFFKDENSKLDWEINELSKKITLNSTSTLAADQVNIMHLTILKNKLEYFEISLQKWLSQGEY